MPSHGVSKNRFLKFYRTCAGIRGLFINEAALIEAIMARIIAGYFCRDKAKRDLLVALVLSRTDMNRKQQCLRAVIERCGGITSEDKKALTDAVKNHQDIRNKLAHSVHDTREEAILGAAHGEAVYVYWKDGVEKSLRISPEQLKEHISKAIRFRDDLLDLEQQINANLDSGAETPRSADAHGASD